ncbi:YdeI/OmpD-associated family protein [Microbacterium halophytorum]|uniref:YdeI/OmpD-associated family protein n=1 Tax=Microbacterium halophytorum TaxID=2067568 RepID=UPI000CFE202E|nr:YdeI/OmpD-associated family protein [Microbacterium halophytorum]
MANAPNQGAPGGTPDKPAVFFRDAAEFRRWLELNHATADELWVEMRKAHVADRGLTWADAVPEALCFGWIDSLSQPVDDDRRRQRWTPRKPRSTWSKINIAHVERLTAEGRMHPAGVAAFEARTADNSGIYSFENADAELAPELQAIIDASPAAVAFLDAATPGYRKLVRHWVASAKREATRESRARRLVECCEGGELVPPARAGGTPAWLARAAEAARATG